jgi:DNA gyrase subunit A
MLNLKAMIGHFVDHRHEVVIRRTQYDLRKAEERAHILDGLLIALDNLDAVIALIRASDTPEEARNGLIASFGLSELQSRAILDMRLQKLTGLERDKVREEHADLMKLIDYLKSILDNEELRMQIIKDELIEIRDKYGDERRSVIEYSANEMSIEDLIADEEVVITVSHLGYIKRTQLTEYKTQSRGGVGSKGSTTRDEDFLEHLFVATNHNYLLIFTEKGKCFWMRVFEVPEGSKASKGRAIQNLINIEPDDKIMAYINVNDLKNKEYINGHYVIMATKNGVVKKTSLESYSRPRTNGINAITIKDGDQLLEAKLTTGNSEIILAKKSGKAIRFNESTVRAVGRNSQGVRGVSLEGKSDEVIGMICIDDPSTNILVVSQKGYGKRSDLDDYRITNRGGKGVKTLNITDKTGYLISIKSVVDTDDLMIINKSGITIRMGVASLRVMGRATQGVRLINLRNGDEIAAVAKVEVSENATGIDEEVDGDAPSEEGADTEPTEEGPVED